MLLKKTGFVVAAFSVLAMSACLAEDDAPTDDQLVGESSLDGEDTGKADFSNTTFTYFSVRPDYRRCVFPLCGGSWVSRVNRAYTRCADGSWSADGCYVATFDWDNLEVPAAQVDAARSGNRYLVRGAIEVKSYENYGDMGHFVPTELWKGAVDAEPSGLVTKVKDSGIRCITTPCYSMNEYKINSWRWIDLAELSFDWTGATDEQINDAHTAVAGDDGLIVAGYRYWRYDNNQWARGRVLTQFYTRVLAGAVPTCHVGGCSSQVCSDRDDVITTCEWRPQYACYRSATCEVQPSGGCGWTSTPELDTCLDDASNPDPFPNP